MIKTTIVRIAVPRFDSIFDIPIFPRIDVKLANTADNIAKNNHLLPLPMIPLHGLRHSCATLLNYLDVNIIDISNILGHAQTSTTMNIYAHSFEKQKRVASDKIDEFLRMNA